MPASCAGCGGLSASFGRADAVGCRSTRATGFAEPFAIRAGFFSDLFSGGLLVGSIFGGDGGAGSFDACAAGVAFGFGVSAGGAESVEGAVEGAAAIGAPSGLTVCEAPGAGLGGAGVKTGGAVSRPKEAADGALKEAGCGKATSAPPTAASELLFAGAALTSGRVSKAPACGRSTIGERESAEG